jgi:hypothetical protein
MPWKVKAFAHRHGWKRVFKTVARTDEFDDDFMQAVSYWVRNMEPGEKVVIRRFPPE